MRCKDKTRFLRLGVPGLCFVHLFNPLAGGVVPPRFPEETEIKPGGKTPQVSFERKRLSLDWQLAMLSRVHYVGPSGRNFSTL